MRRLAASCVLLVLAGCGGGGACTTTRRAAGDGSRTLTIPIRVLQQGRQVIALALVRIDGKGPFTFAIDTGASQSLVDAQVAARIHAQKTSVKTRVAGVAAVGRGRLISVRHWSVGGVTLPATRVLSANLPFGDANGGVQGLLGSDMLSGFDVVTIDYGKQVLRLHPRARR
ncbi:MAG TPA: retropepsin-like aspartic protease [Gaiellaceae bacterium]|nr:retropepsin-like aspartic protease [Gaiellaceae bacterium]